jgi:anti-anti-sigma factor
MILIERIGDNALQIRFKNPSRLTNTLAIQLREEIFRFCQDPCKLIEIDLSGIHFIDAKGFESLVELSNRAQQRHIIMRLSNVSEETWELIDLMQLTQAFEIHKVPNELAAYQHSLS